MQDVHHDQSFDRESILHSLLRTGQADDLNINTHQPTNDNDLLLDAHEAKVIAGDLLNLPHHHHHHHHHHQHQRGITMSASALLSSPLSDQEWTFQDFHPSCNNFAVDTDHRPHFGYEFYDQPSISSPGENLAAYAPIHPLTTWNSANSVIPANKHSSFSLLTDSQPHHIGYAGSKSQISSLQDVVRGLATFSPVSSTDASSSFSNEGQTETHSRKQSFNSTRSDHLIAQIRGISEGARKKNARIDIPMERTLANIEEMIEKACDETEIRELKAHRRLLRNREAALASRQRKKQHTEELEVKEQDYVRQITELKNALTETRNRNEQLEVENEFLHQRHMEQCHVLQTLELEKEEMIINHTHETGTLRRRVQILTDQVDDVATTQSNPNTFGHGKSPVDALGINSGSWKVENSDRGRSDPTIDPLPSALVASQHVDTRDNQPIASGVLFMILLCGAFVASQPEAKPWMPRLPDEVRLASTTVLQNLLGRTTSLLPSSAGHTRVEIAPRYDPIKVDPRTGEWHGLDSNQGSNTYLSSQLGDTSAPNVVQTFQMTPAEYNSLTLSDAYPDVFPEIDPLRSRNLAQTLANLRAESISQVNPAEAYSKSLLWDQIPNEVVEQFRNMIRDRQVSPHALQTDMTLCDDGEDAYGTPNTWTWHLPSS